MKMPLVCTILLLFCSVLAAQSQTQYPTELNLGAPASSQGKMTVNDVIKLSQAGLSDDVIVQQLVKKNQPFDLSTDQIILLKTAGVSGRVIQAMIDPSKASASSAPQPAQNPSAESSQASVPAKSETAANLPTGANGFVASPPLTSRPLASIPSDGNGPRIYFEAASKGSQWNAVRSQTMEMSKDFEKDCPGARITISQNAADYIILLNHIEHGFTRDNQVQVANKNGDLISRTKEGGSIRGDMKKACQTILADWSKIRQ
jgi:hypothetical protein